MINKNLYVLSLGILSVMIVSSSVTTMWIQNVFASTCSETSICVATGGDGGRGGDGCRGGDTGDAFGGVIGRSGDCNAVITDSSGIEGEPTLDQSGKNIGRDCTGSTGSNEHRTGNGDHSGNGGRGGDGGDGGDAIIASERHWDGSDKCLGHFCQARNHRG
jgi:hypothetical protein